MNRLFLGDCRSVLALWPESCVDCVVTDPPYEINFMAKSWDRSGVAFDPETWRAVLRVMKPGAHLVAFAAPRTAHRITCAIEDAGFEIRDCLMWMFGSGFPKSTSIPLECLGAGRGGRHKQGPATEDWANLAEVFEGYGTALKPAYEPIILARKPLIGTVAANVLEHGTGGINIDGTRIEASPEDFAKLQAGVEAVRQKGGVRGNSWKNTSDLSGANPASPLGRWPANLILDEAAGAILDEQAGPRKGMSGGGKHRPDAEPGMFGAIDSEHTARGDNGGPSRFFYCPKASKADRDYGCEDLPELTGGEATGREDGSAGVNNPRAGAGRTGGRKNPHPTVKPSRDEDSVMRWLVRLVAPPGGLVLDPFMGSGSSGVAAIREGLPFAGIDLSQENFIVSAHRIDRAEKDYKP